VSGAMMIREVGLLVWGYRAVGEESLLGLVGQLSRVSEN